MNCRYILWKLRLRKPRQLELTDAIRECVAHGQIEIKTPGWVYLVAALGIRGIMDIWRSRPKGENG